MWKKITKDYSEKTRDKYAEEGIAMSDGSYPIKDAGDLKDAIHLVGRSTHHSEAAVKRHILKRWRALGKPGKEPFSKEGSIELSDGYKPAPHLAKCEDCGSEMEMASVPSSDPDDTRLYASVRCSNESCSSRAKTSSVKTADADVIQFPTFDDESHERITNAINNGHICHFGVMGCGFNKGYIEGNQHPELANPECPVHGSGGAMERHPAGKGDRKLDEENTELADVIPIKRKGSIMSNEFNNRQDEDSFGLWYDEDEFEPKKAAWWNPLSWAPNAVNAVSGLDAATDELEQASQNQINVETAIAAPPAGLSTDQAAEAAYTPKTEQGNLAVSDKAAEMAGSKKPEGPVHEVIKGTQGRTDAINSLIKSTSVQELPQWIEEAKQVIAHDHSEWQAEQAHDEDIEGRINDKLSDPGCPNGECDMAESEHCEECHTCPGDYHTGDCSRSDDYNDSMDGDFDSAMASAGFGTDEDYGYYGGDEW